jgi:DNA-binding MarR family transcriptional regulator
MTDDTQSIKLLFTFRKLMMTLRRNLLIPIAKEFELLPVDMRLLMTLGQHKRKTKKSLAAEVGMDSSAMSRSIERLLEADYVARSLNPKDRREVHIALTKSGVTLYSKLIKQIETSWSLICSEITQECLAEQIEFIEHITTKVQSINNEEL